MFLLTTNAVLEHHSADNSYVLWSIVYNRGISIHTQKILMVYVYVIIIDQSNLTANLYEIQVMVIYNHAGFVTGKQTGKKYMYK